MNKLAELLTKLMEDGITVPENLQKFSSKNTNNEVDLPQIRDALSELPQTDIPQSDQDQIRETLQNALKSATQKLAEDSFRHVSLISLSDGADVSEVEILRAGKLQDRGLVITPKMLNDYVDNFAGDVYGQKVPVNLSHLREGEAAGWFKELFVRGKSLMAKIEWTKLGKEKIGSKLFQFISAELAPRLKHHKTGELFENVLIGAGLTNIPAMKAQNALSLSEEAQQFVNNQNNMDKLKLLYELLMERDSVTPSEFKKFSDEAAEATTDDNKEEVEKMEKDVKENVEEEEEKEEKEEEEEKEEKEEKEDLNEKVDTKELSEKVTKLEEENAEMRATLKLEECSKDIKKNLCLSEGKESTGFKSDKKTVTRVAKFMLSLSDDAQREEFKEILGLHKTVDLSERGSDGGSDPVNGSLKAKLDAADKKAQKLHEESEGKKSLHECLEEVLAEEGLDNLSEEE